jgi:hypothetical protein
VELEAPNKVEFHWWEKSKKAEKLKFEGWPGYSLQGSSENETLVHHHAKLYVYGIYGLAAPIFRWLAVKERTVTVDALKSSFESNQRPVSG